MRSTWRACGLLPALALVVVVIACSDPDLASDLNEEGPPEVLEVNVRSESAFLGPGDPTGLQAEESATYCRPGKQYRVNTVYCPEARDSANAPIAGDRAVETPVMDALPNGWYVRIIFDELLDPDIEDLRPGEDGIYGHIDATQPVTLTCAGVAVDYDGYYDPSGNHLSYPPGPALVVEPAEFIASGTADCEIEVRSGEVVDKDGDAVPSNQIGPYQFGIAPLSIYDISPSDESEGVALDTVITVAFGAPIDVATVADRIVLTDADDTVIATTILDEESEDADGDPSTIELVPTGGLTASTTYTITVTGGVADIAGGELVLAEPTTATFTTGEE
jgi:hypothetical protein